MAQAEFGMSCGAIATAAERGKRKPFSADEEGQLGHIPSNQTTGCSTERKNTITSGRSSTTRSIA